MADRLQGIWVFDKIKPHNNSVSHTHYKWDISFSANGEKFKAITFDASVYSMAETYGLLYWYENPTDSYYIAPFNSSAWVYEAYKTIEIHSKYGEVADAGELIRALEVRATFTPLAEDIQIPMSSAKGVLLKTFGKQCENDIIVTPELDELIATENGEYTPSKVGYSKVTVNVAGSGGGSGDNSLEEYFAGLMTEVTLPTITKIKSYAFYQAGNFLTNITMPNVQEIGTNAFYNCIALNFPSLPSGLTKIKDNGFNGCSNLTLTSLPDSLTSIGQRAFQGCSKLALTSLPSGVTKIDGYTFSSCSNLALTSLPSGITYIATSAFYSCTKLAIKEIPSGVTGIEGSAFYACKGLTEITFKGTPQLIMSCFSACTNLTTINVPWAEGAVSGAPWGATSAQINYSYTGE